MTFSDLYITDKRNLKVEILPSDMIGEHKNIVEADDRLITVFRPIDSPFVAERLAREFANEFKDRRIYDRQNTEDALRSTINAFHFSFLNPPADLNLRPESGAMVLVVHVDSHGNITIANCGSITLKEKIDGRFEAVITPSNYFIGHPGHPFDSGTESFSQIIHLTNGK